MSPRLVRFFPALAAFVLATLLLFVPPFIESLSHETEVSAAPVMQGEPTPEATPEPIPTPEPVAEVAVDLTTDQPQIEAGETVTYTVVITNTTDEVVGDMVLSSTLPPSTTFVADPNSAVIYDPLSNTITWDAGDVPADTILTVTYQIQADSTVTDTQVVAGVELSSPDLTETLTGWDVIDVGEPPTDTAWITPDGGSFALATNDIRLIVPKGTLDEPLRFGIVPLSSTLPGYLFAGYEFRAWTKAETQVTTFTTPLTLIGNVNLYWETFRATEGAASFYWLNDTTATWELIPSTMDLATGYVTAEIEHFSGYGFGSGGDATYGVDHLPTIHRFGNDEWSGNSSAGYPLILPPAPGNLPFGLSLAYSSEGVNALFAGNSSEYGFNLPYYKRQASHVGWGWTLSGLGSIQVIDGASHEAYVNFPGGSQKLTRPSNGDAWSWQSDPQTFIRINSSSATAADATKWTIYSKDGLRYTFGADDWTGQSVAYNLDGCSTTKAARQLYLTEIRDVHNNYIEIQYNRTSRNLTGCGSSGYDYIRDVRPTLITYYAAGTPAQPTAKIEFRYGARIDYGIEKWNDWLVQSLYSTQRIEGIEISVLGPSGQFQAARKYTLAYNYTDFPNNSESLAQLMTLVSITDQGQAWSDVSALPSYSFSYTKTNSNWLNTTVLYTASNGYGGEVEYHYRSTGNFEISVCNGFTVDQEELGSYVTYRYYVDRMKTFDGLSGTPIQTVNLTATSPYATAHGTENPFCNRAFEFGGYEGVSRAVRNSAGAVVQRGVNHYYQTDPGYPGRVAPQAGKPRYIKMLNADNVLLTQETLTWTAITSVNTPWVALKTKISEVSGTPAVTSRTIYTYSLATNGFPYGLPQQVAEYLNGAFYRKSETSYVEDNVALRFLVLPRQMNRVDANNACIGMTMFAYDNGANYTTTPTLGNLTASKSATTTWAPSGCNNTQATWVESEFGYDSWGNQTIVTDTRNYRTTTVYDTSGAFPRLYAYPITTTLPTVTAGAFRTVYQWNKYLGQVEQVVDKANNVTLQTYSYDEFGRVKEVTTPESGRIKYVYPPTTSTLQLPYRVQVHTLLNVTPPGTWQFQHQFYDGLGRGIEGRTSYQGTTHTVTYTKYHALGGVEYAYAPIERPAATTYVTPDQWNGQPYTFTKYDALGRPIAVRATDNTTTTMSYGTATLNGRPLHLQTVQEPRGTTVRQYTDALGRMVAVQEMTGTNGATLYATTLYTYTTADLLDQVKDQGGNITDMNYDLLGRKTSMDDPDMGYWHYLYDANGNLTGQVDANNNGVCFQFDALNRPFKKRVYTGANLATVILCNTSGVSYEANYTYDGDIKGLRSGMSDPTGTTTWDYDNLGRIIREDKHILYAGGGYDFAMAYTYDQASRIKTMTYMPGSAGAETVTYAYDAPYINQLDSIIGTTTYLTGVVYNRYNQVTSQAYGNGVTQTFEYWGLDVYRGAGRLRVAKAGTNSTYDNLQHLRYEHPTATPVSPGYDVAGNVEYIVNRMIPYAGGYHRHYLQYDPLNRLRDANVAGPSGSGIYAEGYTYYENGNLKKRDSVTDMVYTYRGNAPHAVTGVRYETSGQTTYTDTYSYDAVGNLTQRKRHPNGATGGMVTDTLVYDGENRLVSVALNDSINVNALFKYDGDGNRVYAWTAGETTLHPFPMLEYRFSGTQLVKYYMAGSQRVAMREDTTLYYFLQDHLGSTSLTLNSSGAKVAETRYDVWGKPFWQWQTTPTNRLYTGQLWDGKVQENGTGLYFYNSRYYDPALGRFTQADSIVPNPNVPQSLNRFSYVLNNPLKYIDPSGHYACSSHELDGEGTDYCYGIEISQDFTQEEIDAIIQALHEYKDFLGGEQAFFDLVTANLDRIWKDPTEINNAKYNFETRDIRIGASYFGIAPKSLIYGKPERIPLLTNNKDYRGHPGATLSLLDNLKFVLAHELTHVVVTSISGVGSGYPLIVREFEGAFFTGGKPDTENPLTVKNVDRRNGREELFADVIATYIYEMDGLSGGIYDSWIEEYLIPIIRQ